jgi:hypothetical protein
MLDLKYFAGGSAWRRVRDYQRPALDISISSFHPVGNSWRGLEQISFWSENDDDEDSDDDWLPFGSGYVDVWFRANQDGVEDEQDFGCDFLWRVAAREGRFLIVELAGITDGSARERVEEHGVMVLVDGTEERAARDAEFWKANSQIYLVERVPFGTVTVQVPRNSRDAESAALARAETLIGGLGQPEHVEVRDYYHRGAEIGGLSQDLYVELHFHGYYEE